MIIHRIFPAFVFLACVMIISTVATVVWALFIDQPYLSYKNLPFPTTIQKVRAGEVIPLRVYRCNDTDTVQVYTVAHLIVSLDKELPSFVLPPNELVPIEAGCTEAVSMINRIPQEAPPGTYSVVGVARIPMLLGRKALVPWHSQPFEVMP